MIRLDKYMLDGACPAARAVLALLQGRLSEDLMNPKGFYPMVVVGRWENCREQGYVVSIRSRFPKEGEPFEVRQLNVAFFEHRNSDSICAVKWEQETLNSPTIESMEAENVYEDKYDVSHSVDYDKHYEMADWIATQLEEFDERNDDSQT